MVNKMTDMQTTRTEPSVPGPKDIRTTEVARVRDLQDLNIHIMHATYNDRQLDGPYRLGGFDDTYILRRFDRHINKEDGSVGGWVETKPIFETFADNRTAQTFEAFAGEDTYIGPHVLVVAGSRVFGNARLTGHIIVSDSEVSDNAELSGRVEIHDIAIYDDAKVHGTGDGLTIEDGAHIGGNVTLSGSGTLSGKRRLTEGVLAHERRGLLGYKLRRVS